MKRATPTCKRKIRPALNKYSYGINNHRLLSFHKKVGHRLTTWNLQVVESTLVKTAVATKQISKAVCPTIIRQKFEVLKIHFAIFSEEIVQLKILFG